MVDKVKSWNWKLINMVTLILGNLGLIVWVSLVAMKTTQLENSNLMTTYSIIGFLALLLFKLNNAAITDESN